MISLNYLVEATFTIFPLQGQYGFSKAAIEISWKELIQVNAQTWFFDYP